MKALIFSIVLIITVEDVLMKRHVTKELFVGNGGQYGYWKAPQYCPPGTFASGFSMKIEADQFSGDDTALNAIKLTCTDMSGHAQIGYQITSEEGPFGSWSSNENCAASNFLIGFSLQVEGPQGSGDDTSANYIKFLCRDYEGNNRWTELNHPPGKGIWGSFGAFSDRCDANSAICGLATKIESTQGSGDDTSLNDVKFYCCDDADHGPVVG